MAAAGACSAVVRARLLFLVSRAETLLQQVVGMGRQGEGVRRRVEALHGLILARLLSVQGVGMAADEYFSRATEAVDEVYAWIDAHSRSLEQCLGEANGPGNPSAVV